MPATSPCPAHVVGKRIENASGRTVYTDPGQQAITHEIMCNGKSVWVMFHGGAASSQEAYVLVRSSDGGRTFRLVAAESYFGVKAPHELDSVSGPWTITGPNDGYFIGECPACGRGTISLWITHDGGRTFTHEAVPALAGHLVLRSVRVAGNVVTIVARGRTATVHA
ncbi:MAG: hypothetical protein JOY73_06010 [Actinobacteria bacterium]|nr:hypothetical protein [Actinomycetota bacterium]